MSILGKMSAEKSHEQRLKSLSIELPEPLPPFGEYVPAVVAGDFLWVGGHFGIAPDGSFATGRCGVNVSVDEAKVSARSAAMNLLATVRHTLGTLDKVKQVVHLYGVVNASPDFVEHTGVIDAASAVLVEVFGEAGRHTRLAVGVSSLPGNLTLEIEAQILLRKD